MQTPMLETKSVEIGGRVFTIRKLNYREALKVYCNFQKLIAAFFDDSKPDGLSLFQIAGLLGHVSHEDLKWYVEAFGPSTTVDFGDGRVLPLVHVPANFAKGLPEVDPVAECFGGALEDMFTWLDECARFNFAGLIAKTAGALRNMPAGAPEQKA